MHEISTSYEFACLRVFPAVGRRDLSCKMVTAWQLVNRPPLTKEGRLTINTDANSYGAYFIIDLSCPVGTELSLLPQKPLKHNSMACFIGAMILMSCFFNINADVKAELSL